LTLSLEQALVVLGVIARHKVPKQSLKAMVRLLRFARNDSKKRLVYHRKVQEIVYQPLTLYPSPRLLRVGYHHDILASVGVPDIDSLVTLHLR